MLSQISQSSKRLGKLKKYKTKVKQSGFQFLLQSLQRDKENHAPNLTANHNNLSHSIQIDPLLTAPVHSFTLSNCNTLTNANNGKFYIENVKLLDRSDITVSEANHSIPSKKSAKHRENSHKISSKSKNNKKQVNKNVSSKSKNSQNDQLQELIYKMKQYLTITDDILNQIDTSKWKSAKKARGISQDLITLIVHIETAERQRKGNKMNHSIKTTSFNMYGSQIINSGKDSQEFVKRINGLEVQKEKLNSLISQHQMANIKMYIKMNQGESEEIQQCKKQLSLLFEKYKKLQNYIKNDKKRIEEMLTQKQQLTKRCQELNSQNMELMTLIQKYQLAFQKQKNAAKQRESHLDKPMRISMLRADKHIREQSYPNFEDSSQQQKSQLRIESLCNQSRFSQDIGLSSSITTSTSRINSKKGGKLGINLNSLLDSLSQNQLQKMAQSPEKLKKMMRQCKQTIMKMQSIIQQQNKELQLSIVSLQSFKQKLDEKMDTINKLQSRVKQYEKDKIKRSKQNKCMNESQSKSKKVIKKEQKGKMEIEEKKKVEVDQKGKVTMDITFKKTKFDQYRIIAMQAMALEQAIINQQMR